MSELAPRQQTILRAVIIEYVRAAEPVASEQLASKYELGVKSATVRNELAEMADLGYLEQPHTSAGRVPSEKGYRFYVDHLVTRQTPKPEERQAVRNVTTDGEVLHDLLQQTTRALSQLTHLMSAATTVRDGQVTVRSAIVSALGPHQALFVLVLSNGDVENRLVECPADLTLQDVGVANEAIQRAIVGKSLRSLLRAKLPVETPVPLPAAEQLLTSLMAVVRSVAREATRGHVLREGEEFLFAQPEYRRDAALLQELADTLQHADLIYDTLNTTTDQTGTVTIGKEHRHEKMHQLSVVRQRFYVGDKEAGTIAVIGPTRMAYDSSIPLVNFTAKALSETLSKFFG